MKKLNKINFFVINLIFAFIPISLLVGNLASNFNILLLVILSSFVFFLNYEKLKFKINVIDKLILIFFFYTLITLAVSLFLKNNDGIILKNLVITKTIFYQKYLVYYFIIRVLLEKEIIDIYWFNITGAFCACFLCLDIYFQYLFGKDFFGIEPFSSRHFSALFGKELIAGGYLQKFGLFAIFFFYSLKKDLIFKKNYILFFIYIFIFIGIVLSGNRVPLILFLLSILVLVYFNQEIKKYLKYFIIISIFVFFIIYNINNNLKIHFNNFYKNGIILIETTLFKDLSKESIELSKRPYVVEFFCAKLFIKQDPILGNGIRSFRARTGGCSTHPHNYYLEILVDLGLIGFVIILSIIFFISKKIIYNINSKISLPIECAPYLTILTTEFFPIRTSGSMFSTGNAIIIFTSISVVVTFIYKKKTKNKIL